jgi:U3 small nucleolar RNA-associated protein 3
MASRVSFPVGRQAAPEQSRVAAKLAEREAFEEEHFTRLPTTRADRALKRQRLAATLEDELDALRDYTDLADYTAAVAKKERAAATAPAVGSKRGAPEADTRDRAAEEDDEGADVDEEAAAYYRQVERAQERKRQDREAAASERRQAAVAAGAADGADDDGDDDDGAGGKRGATTAMLKNKGLTARRKKEQRNPRVRRRMQYEKAQKKLASTGVRVAVTGGARAVYGGESTGIKRNLARSVALK